MLGLGRLIAHPALVPARRWAKRQLVAASERLLGRQSLHGKIGPAGLYSLAVPGLAGPYLLTRGLIPIEGCVLDLERGEPMPWRARIGRRVIEAAPREREDVVAAFARMSALPLRCGGGLELRVRPGPTLIRIEAQTGPGAWTTIFRCIAVCLHTDFGSFDRGDGCAHYPAWRAREMRISELDAGSQRRYADLVGSRPSVTAVICGPAGEELEETLSSLRAQTFPAWNAIVVGCGRPTAPYASAPTFAAALAAASGDYVVPLKAGDRLQPEALYTLAAVAQASPGLDLIYADEESGTDGEDPLPFFKPAWSPDMLESFNYLGAPVLFSTALARETPAEDAYDLALRFTEAERRVHHVPKVLCRRVRAAIATGGEEADRRALAARLARTGRTGTIEPVERGFGCYRLDICLPQPAPLVSIVIPTAGRDLEIAGRRLDLIVDCVRGIRERSTYPAIEIVVVVNPDLAPAKSRALADLGCRTTLYDDPVLNIARKLNLGAALANGDLLLLLNDDVEIISPDWIERLVAQATKPHVGVAGAKLLYPDETVQHAGVVILNGNPNHVRRGYPEADLGYFLSSAAVRNYGAVTGACMMTRRELFVRVGGYSEDFPIHFNDVDYCFKLRALGLHVVFEPACRLYHFESVSRAPSIHPEELALFQERWGSMLDDDPFYPNHAFGTRPPAFEIFMRATTHVP